MNDLEIIRNETFKKLTLLRKQYLKLPHEEFLCDGADHIWSLQLSIIDIILSRFKKYTSKHLQLINTLFPFFEKICGYLDDSKTVNVPWSIIPSLEELFSKIRPNTKFVICPLWETNYQIYNRNVIEIITEQILAVPGLLFDPTNEFENKYKEFLKDYPSGIYFVFYPRTERLTVLHFPLLGHEIGHIYSLIWLNNNFNKLLKKYSIEEELKKEIKGNIRPDAFDPLFIDTFVEQRALEILEIYQMVLAETISDLVGTFIFGPSTLFSSYIFALKFGLDDFRGVTDGYLSWRFRIYFISNALKHMKRKDLPGRYVKANRWVNDIYKIVEVDIQNFSYPNQINYIKHIVELIQNSFTEICVEIETFLGDQNYKINYDEEHQKEVFERLSNGILPNCVIDKKLYENPIGLRNIVAGTWIYLTEIDMSDYNEYYQQSISANLLSLKAIELSNFQKDFYQRTSK